LHALLLREQSKRSTHKLLRLNKPTKPVTTYIKKGRKSPPRKQKPWINLSSFFFNPFTYTVEFAFFLLRKVKPPLSQPFFVRLSTFLQTYVVSTNLFFYFQMLFMRFKLSYYRFYYTPLVKDISKFLKKHFGLTLFTVTFFLYFYSFRKKYFCYGDSLLIRDILKYCDRHLRDRLARLVSKKVF